MTLLDANNGTLPSMRDFRDTLEKEYLNRLMAQSTNDIQEATRISGVSRSRLYELFSKHRLNHSKSPAEED
jgi:DNA-binding NtrC family response regulator